MSENSVQRNQTSARMSSLEARIPDNFEGGGAQYIPIAGLYPVNGAEEPAIGRYMGRAPESGQYALLSINGNIQWSSSAPSEGTYVLGSKNGIIQWIATESCDE